MTCSHCEKKVQKLLSGVPGVKDVEINLAAGEAKIIMDTHVPTAALKNALKDFPTYGISEKEGMHMMAAEILTEKKSWLETYKPILLVFGYILAVTLSIEMISGSFLWMRWMQYFMAGFFLVFSFFKMLDLKGFAESYATYDIIAKKWTSWGFVYAFIELGLGLGYLTGWNPLVVNAVTFVVMTISIIGVLQSVLNKRKIRCACLGAVFNLPMSTITIIEDGLMIGMSAVMLLQLI
jgi:copper chaperone CopZ